MADYDLTIVGGGMVGLALAVASSKTNNLGTALVDHSLPSAAVPVDLTYLDQRFSAVNPNSERFLSELGAWPRIKELGVSPYRRMVVWDATGQGEIEFDSRDIGQPYLGHIVANQVIQSALLKQVKDQANIEIFCPAIPELLIPEQEAMVLRLADGRALASRLLVGADGANSWVRKQAGISLRQWSYQQASLTATVSTEKPHEQTAWQRFLPTGPLAFLPLQDTAQCSIVWTTTIEQASYLLTAPEEEFNQQLAQAFDHRLGKIQVLGKREVFPLTMRHVKQYIKPHLALLGDAAHTLHPLAGQGVNLGFKDAKCLRDVLLTDFKTNNPHDDFKLLRRYERARKADNWEMISVVEGFKRLFSNDSVTLSMLRNFGLNLTNKHPWAKRAIMWRAMGI